MCRRSFAARASRSTSTDERHVRGSARAPLGRLTGRAARAVARTAAAAVIAACTTTPRTLPPPERPAFEPANTIPGRRPARGHGPPARAFRRRAAFRSGRVPDSGRLPRRLGGPRQGPRAAWLRCSPARAQIPRLAGPLDGPQRGAQHPSSGPVSTTRPPPSGLFFPRRSSPQETTPVSVIEVTENSRSSSDSSLRNQEARLAGDTHSRYRSASQMPIGNTMRDAARTTYERSNLLKRNLVLVASYLAVMTLIAASYS